MNLISLSQAHHKIFTTFVVLFIFLFSCNSNPQRKSGIYGKPIENHPKAFSLVSPSTDQICVFGDNVNFSIEPRKTSLITDSIELYVEGKKIYTERSRILKFSNTSIFNKVGRQDIRLKVFYNDSLVQILTTRLTVLSDVNPRPLKYKVLRKFPHNSAAYTQGLFYYKGILYEGTGLKSRSEIKKINPLNGETIMARKLENYFFGEGITLFNNQIYQLTYLSRVGLVYELETFELIRKFDLQTKEGWGLTNDGHNLIMSDGSSILYLYDPEYYTQVGQLDVFDNKGLANRLNELEYVNGSIFANIYGQTYILEIEANTGKVIGKLELRDIFPEDIPDDLDHVMNGIAYNPDGNTYFITGKLWPVMYEISIFE